MIRVFYSLQIEFLICYYCFHYTERHEEDIETAFAERKENLENLICYEISKACEGVDRTKKPKDYSGIDLTTNGEKQKVEKVVNVDPATGKTVVEDVDAETKESEGIFLQKSFPCQLGSFCHMI